MVWRRGLHDKNYNFFLNPRWWTAAILKIVKSPYLSQKSSDFDEIWYTTSDIEPDYSHVTKNWNFEKFKMAAAAILKIAFFGHNSSTVSDFSEILYEESERYVDEGYITKTASF